jgi:hypothetical protein
VEKTRAQRAATPHQKEHRLNQRSQRNPTRRQQKSSTRYIRAHTHFSPLPSNHERCQRAGPGMMISTYPDACQSRRGDGREFKLRCPHQKGHTHFTPSTSHDGSSLGATRLKSRGTGRGSGAGFPEVCGSGSFQKAVSCRQNRPIYCRSEFANLLLGSFEPFEEFHQGSEKSIL